MNCFQFDYFCGYHTALKVCCLVLCLLWIAFNLITFVDITQQCSYRIKKSTCCELLSIWLLLWISHSLPDVLLDLPAVVNCFQFDYFCGYHTARRFPKAKPKPLWIAFNLITFVDITQPSFSIVCRLRGCELLSIWLLLWISHSKLFLYIYSHRVVNCFQFDYFCGYHTACKIFNAARTMLWIAFNLITFVDITQRISWFIFEVRGCELLSIWLLLWISHSHSFVE